MEATNCRSGMFRVWDGEQDVRVLHLEFLGFCFWGSFVYVAHCLETFDPGYLHSPGQEIRKKGYPLMWRSGRWR